MLEAASKAQPPASPSGLEDAEFVIDLGCHARLLLRCRRGVVQACPNLWSTARDRALASRRSRAIAAAGGGRRAAAHRRAPRPARLRAARAGVLRPRAGLLLVVQPAPSLAARRCAACRGCAADWALPRSQTLRPLLIICPIGYITVKTYTDLTIFP